MGPDCGEGRTARLMAGAVRGRWWVVRCLSQCLLLGVVGFVPAPVPLLGKRREGWIWGPRPVSERRGTAILQGVGRMPQAGAQGTHRAGHRAQGTGQQSTGHRGRDPLATPFALAPVQ